VLLDSTVSVLDMYNAKVVIVGPSSVGKVYFTVSRIIIVLKSAPRRAYGAWFVLRLARR